MRRSLISLLAATLSIGGLAVLAPDAAATAQCIFTPVLPKRVVINQAVVGMHAALKISGDSRCATDLSVTTHLVHSTDEYFLLWDSRQDDVESVYDWGVAPGTYRTTGGDCTVWDADFNELTCTVASAATVIKFAAHPKLRIVRKGSKLTFTARATRYGPLSAATPMTASVRIQRLSATGWHTVHTATAKGRAGYTWAHTYSKTARYRVVSAETSAAFAGTSASIRK